jgi:uncharacterized protein YukE
LKHLGDDHLVHAKERAELQAAHKAELDAMRGAMSTQAGRTTQLVGETQNALASLGDAHSRALVELEGRQLARSSGVYSEISGAMTEIARRVDGNDAALRAIVGDLDHAQRRISAIGAGPSSRRRAERVQNGQDSYAVEYPESSLRQGGSSQQQGRHGSDPPMSRISEGESSAQAAPSGNSSVSTRPSKRRAATPSASLDTTELQVPPTVDYGGPSSASRHIMLEDEVSSVRRQMPPGSFDNPLAEYGSEGDDDDGGGFEPEF